MSVRSGSFQTVRRIAALAALALVSIGCGRLGFDDTGDASVGDPDGGRDGLDAVPCVPAGHDEDGDGIDDACDVCPQLAGSQADGDGDGIGDDCDLAPTRQVRILFDPFVEARPEWVHDPRVELTGDAARYTPTVGGYGSRLLLAPGRDVFEVAGMVATSATTERQLSIQLYNGTASYYCELYDAGATMALQFTYTLDGVDYVNADSAPLTGPLENGRFRLIFDHDPPNARCLAEWQGDAVEVSGLIPAAITSVEAYVVVYQVEASLSSFVRLVTPP